MMQKEDGRTRMYELTEILKHFVNGAFIGVDHNALLVQHQDVHGQPFGGHPQRVVCTERESVVVFFLFRKHSTCSAYVREAAARVPTIRNQRRWRFHNSPASLLEHVDLSQRAKSKCENEACLHIGPRGGQHRACEQRKAASPVLRYLEAWAIGV